MTLLPSIRLWLLLLLAVGGTAWQASSASARLLPPIEERAQAVLEDCLQAIEDELQGGLQGIDDQKLAAIERIGQLASQGQPAKLIAKSAKKGKKSLSSPARSVSAEINRLTGTCFIQLKKMGADREFTNPLLAARSDAFAQLKRAIREASSEIDAAAEALVP